MHLLCGGCIVPLEYPQSGPVATSVERGGPAFIIEINDKVGVFWRLEKSRAPTDLNAAVTDLGLSLHNSFAVEACNKQ